MKYVVDSSVAFKWVVREADSDKADLLRAVRKGRRVFGLRWQAWHGGEFGTKPNREPTRAESE